MTDEKIEKSTLYVVATPIGNLGDISPRALGVLEHVDFVLCEDTRHSGLLLEHFGIRQKLVSYFAHNEALRTDQFLPRLLSGESAAVISDAGTPGISDPGARIADACQNAGIRVCPIPGPSAVISAVSAAGFYEFTGFEFVAFFPRKSRERKAMFEEKAMRPTLLVGYESPQRVLDLLVDLESVTGPGRRICMARELTKKFETILRTTVGELRQSLQNNALKGEICLVVEGIPASKCDSDPNELSPESQKLADLLIKHEVSARDIRDIVSDFCGARPKSVYQYVLSSQQAPRG